MKILSKENQKYILTNLDEIVDLVTNLNKNEEELTLQARILLRAYCIKKELV